MLIGAAIGAASGAAIGLLVPVSCTGPGGSTCQVDHSAEVGVVAGAGAVLGALIGLVIPSS